MNLKKVRNIRRHVCKGCLNFEQMSKDYRCSVPHIIAGHKCPCSICLIKGVCQEACDTVREYHPKPRKKPALIENNEYFMRWDRDRIDSRKDNQSLLDFYARLGHVASSIKR